MGKVYVKKENTHNKIEIAFRELLSQKPFKDITINNIVEKAGINRSTFYTHFQDKYELLNDILLSVMNKIYEMVHFDFLLMDDAACLKSLKADVKNILLYINSEKKVLNVQKHSKRALYNRDLIQKVIDVFIQRLNEPPLSEINLPLQKECFAVYFINGLFSSIEYWTVNELIDGELLPTSIALEDAVDQITNVILLSFARKITEL